MGKIQNSENQNAVHHIFLNTFALGKLALLPDSTVFRVKMTVNCPNGVFSFEIDLLVKVLLTLFKKGVSTSK